MAPCVVFLMNFFEIHLTYIFWEFFLIHFSRNNENQKGEISKLFGRACYHNHATKV